MNKKIGRILYIDLSSQKIETKPLRETLRKDFIGGRGVNSKILYDEVSPEVTPLSPENRLIFGTGPLSGTLAPACSRYTITSKSPLTGILGDANSGGAFGPELKLAGYDHLVLFGKANSPVYLWIKDDHVEIKPAEYLWGKGTSETEKMIMEELGDRSIQVSTIGPAGENLVKFAAVMHHGSAAGRTGMGAVMGSKNLKAVAVRGTKGVRVAKPKIFMKLASELKQKLVEGPVSAFLSVYGTNNEIDFDNDNGLLTVKNYQQTGNFEGIKNLRAKNIADHYYVGSNSCFNCPIHCKQRFEVKEGPYAGERGKGVELTAFVTFGAGCDNSYAPSIFKINNLANEYGLDIFSYGNLMGIAMEWFEKGIINLEDTEGIKLEWGNYEAMIEMLNKIVKREGIGNTLAEGAVRASKRIGKGAERCVSHSKGLTWSSVDARALIGFALCFATNTRGADHLRAVMPELFSFFPEFKDSASEHAKAKFGSREALNPTSYHKSKARAAIYYQNLGTLADSLELCKFVTEFSMSGINAKEMAALFSAATGIEMSEEEMKAAADRIYTLEKAFLLREGMSRKDDFLEGKWGSEPISSGPFKGEKIDKENFDHLLSEWYGLRGWNRETGVPTKNTLEGLKLGYIADDLKAMGKL